MVVNKKVSIQLALGGRSFSNKELSTDMLNAECVEFVIDTSRVTLAPREEVSLDTADALLQLVGRACHADEVSVCSELQNDIVAVMAVERNALSAILEQFGSRASFTSPLLDMRHSEESCLTIDWSGKVAYMRIFNGGLRRAEAIAVATVDDLLYSVVEWLAEQELPIYIKGERSAAKLLAKYFSRVVCE